MTKKQAIKKTVEHWARMIKWVEGLKNKRAKADGRVMQETIKEDWYADNCALCKLYNQTPDYCDKCPLKLKYKACGAWGGVNNAVTWKGWLQHAKRMLKQLKSL